MRLMRLASLLVLVPALAGCSRDAEPAPEVQTQPAAEAAPAALTVTGVELGNAITPEKRIAEGGAKEEFAPMETIYASVATDGSASSATLTARWTYQDGQVVDETTQTIAAAGPAVTEFHIAKPDGFPAGQYKVEIMGGGASVLTRNFTVR